VYRLDEWLARELIKGYEAAGLAKPDLIVPVPLHPVRRILRGFNQSERMAVIAGKQMGIPVTNVLRRVRNTRRQAALPKEKRRLNILGAFRASETLNGETIMLIDDVRTTGATVINCVNALKFAGAKTVIVATIAKAEDRKNGMI